MIETGHRFNDESYLKWFGWALLTLGRDLEAGHAAAEAACQAEADGQPLVDIQSAARKAGDRPQVATPARIALTEWAFWAQTTFGQDQSASLRAARKALAELESTHDLESTTKRMRDMLGEDSAAATSTATDSMAEPVILRSEAAAVTTQATSTAQAASATQAATVGVAETTPTGEPPQTRIPRLPIRAWLAVMAVVLVGVGIFLWAFVISPKVLPPTINTSVGGGYVKVTVDNYPANQYVYFYVDRTPDQVVTTDGSGHASVFLVVAAGQHDIAACRDSIGYDCPASAQVFK